MNPSSSRALEKSSQSLVEALRGLELPTLCGIGDSEREKLAIFAEGLLFLCKSARSYDVGRARPVSHVV